MDKEIIFVTTNKGKIASAQKYLKGINVIGYNAELIEPRSDDIKEIAKQKVIQAYRLVNKPCISLDAGFYVEELNGFPRAYVNYMLDTIGIEGLLKLMDGVENRSCYFKSVIAYYDGTNFEFFESISPGVLTTEPRGIDKSEQWSKLWYVFIPENYNKTLAELTPEDREAYDTDTRREPFCMQKFAEWYNKKQ